MKSCFVLVSIIGLVSSLPVEDAVQKFDVILPVEEAIINPNEPEVDISQGDMILSPLQKKTLFKSSKLRNGLRNPFQIWPGAVVYFQFSPTIRKLF